ncbi:11835_t:CDS:2 [Acaulospora colombiana]|uniref:11835_t:CDS:1 n=1 Tax=Acaulospora colombiana TaxID=27376 RepID=A0ACA9LN44_9GLOM|nr:11835_t:CDS:2 [Acaulospora colombiana]
MRRIREGLNRDDRKGKRQSQLNSLPFRPSRQGPTFPTRQHPHPPPFGHSATRRDYDATTRPRIASCGARMGARLTRVRTKSLITVCGLVSTELTVICPCALGEIGADATVCRISPIWHVTAVQGNVPINAPIAHWSKGTEHTPEAILMPDQGTIPMRRRTERRAHGLEEVEDGDLAVDDRREAVVLVDEVPWRALRVRAMAEGKKRVMMGVSGVAKMVERTEPIVVNVVCKRVAQKGESNVPVNIFYSPQKSVPAPIKSVETLTSNTLPVPSEFPSEGLDLTNRMGKDGPIRSSRVLVICRGQSNWKCPERTNNEGGGQREEKDDKEKWGVVLLLLQ